MRARVSQPIAQSKPSGSTRGLRRTLIPTIALGSALGIAATGLASPASADEIADASSSTARSVAMQGLYGSQDPTYNGVYRQGLAILALRAAGKKPAPKALNWLINQQCGDGGFMAFRDPATEACSAPNTDTYSGEDTNSTAMGAAALIVSGQRARAQAAVRWLQARQSVDGGFAYYPSTGAQPDSNSTALVVMALRAAGRKVEQVRSAGGNSPMRYLRSAQLDCSANEGSQGALQYQPGAGTANNLASGPGAFALTPLVTNKSVNIRTKKIRKALPGSPCPNFQSQSVFNTLVRYLGQTMANNGGALPDSFTPGSPDVGSTAAAVFALANARYGKGIVDQGINVLRTNASKYLVSANNDGSKSYDASSLANYILAAKASGRNPYKFTGINLVKSLQSTRQG